MTYIRHRNRMVRQSVMQDLRATLTTSDAQLGWIPRTSTDSVLGMVSDAPVEIKE